jgi:hypothetical protein
MRTKQGGHEMRRITLIISLLAAAVAALAAAVPASASQQTQHRYTSVIRSMPLSTAHGYPAVGGTAVLAGTWTTSLYGTGALVDHVTITGNPTPTTFTFRGTEVGYLPNGTFKDTFTGTSTVQPDGSQFLSTKGRITGGTSAYRGAKGSFKYRGSTVPGSSLIGGWSIGTVSY